jgi:hypothetical protein
MLAMSKNKRLDEVLRQAVRKSEYSKYRLWKLSGVRPEQITRFLNGQNLGISRAAALADVLGLELRKREN